MTLEHNRSVEQPRFTPEERRQLRRLVLRSGPGAVARMIGQFGVDPALLQAIEAAPLSDLSPAPTAAYSWRAPLIDIFDEGSSLLVVADLPGAASVRPHIVDNRLAIEVDQSGAYHFCDLPVPVASDVAGYTFHNSVLSLRLVKKQAL